ncbi:MAG: hypothetical protein ACLQHS_08820 [Candidatus Limnocylindrales bacterium]|jgi:hypothetical protein
MLRDTLRIIALTCAVVVLIALDASPALAASALGGKLRYGDTVIVPAGETVNSDLYVFAGTVTVDGAVHGDVVAAGGRVTIDGAVDGDVIAGGGAVEIDGTVGGGVRAAGGQVTVAGAVTKDVLAGGGTLTIVSGARVGGDLIFSAGRVSVNGDVAGSIQGNAVAYTRTGSLGGSETVHVGQPAPTPRISTGGPVADALRHYVVVLLLGLLALWLLPRGLRSASELVRSRPLAVAGSGLLGLLGYVLALVALLAVMIALAIAFGLLTLGTLVAIDVVAWILASVVLTFAFILAAAFLSVAVVGLTLGRLVLPPGGVERWQEIAALALGSAVVVLVTSLPLIGPWAEVVVIVVGLGGLLLAGWAAWRSRHGGPTPPVPVTWASPAS